MSDHFSVQDHFRENRLFINRIIASILLMLLGISALVARLVYLQVTGHEQFSSLSRDNQIKIAPIPPNRGMIFDRNGEPIAENIVTYSLEVTPELVKDVPSLLQEIRKVINLSETEIAQFEDLKAHRKNFESVPIRLGLTEEEVARLAVKLPWINGAEIHTRMMRNYPYRELTAHVAGYISRINEKEMSTLDPAQYRGTFFVGKNGL
jgi:penicillin-binding protein 2